MSEHRLKPRVSRELEVRFTRLFSVNDVGAWHTVVELQGEVLGEELLVRRHDCGRMREPEIQRGPRRSQLNDASHQLMMFSVGFFS